MPANKEYDYQEWFRKAEDDELSIGAILKEGVAPSTACFLAQQAAEKYLKGRKGLPSRQTGKRICAEKD